MMKNSLADLASTGTMFWVRVTPSARANTVVRENDTIKVGVTAPPADGQANAAVLALLSKALGVPKSRLALVRGAKARDKLFCVD